MSIRRKIPAPSGSRTQAGWWRKLLRVTLSRTRTIGEAILRRIRGGHFGHPAAVSLTISKDTAEYFYREWERILAKPEEPAHPNPTREEQAILERIRQCTEASNRNNVTRAAAYLEVYLRHPELHWAFLAHMVTRNGGWCMTDLQGDLLPHLIGEKQRNDIFLFLERANALIFQDAYPQLLLYEESKRNGRPLFHLLPSLFISSFMRPVWERFWLERLPAPLTICLIINEQNYIEHRVVQSGYYEKQVVHTLPFRALSLLQLDQLLFPYEGDVVSEGTREFLESNGPMGSIKLCGLILEDFSDLKERIGFGKSLYGILFGIPDITRGALAFAKQQPHTGSRADYGPHLFASIQKAPPSGEYTERLDGAGLKPGAALIYSPPLSAAWRDHPIDPIERFDWFRNLDDAADHLKSVIPPQATDMTLKACEGLRRIELAVLAAQAVGLSKH